MSKAASNTKLIDCEANICSRSCELAIPTVGTNNKAGIDHTRLSASRIIGQRRKRKTPIQALMDNPKGISEYAARSGKRLRSSAGTPGINVTATANPMIDVNAVHPKTTKITTQIQNKPRCPCKAGGVDDILCLFGWLSDGFPHFHAVHEFFVLPLWRATKT
jgi:hypothetical protein